MLRFVNVCLFFGLVALAYVIYQVKYESHALDDQIAGLNKQIDGERDTITELRAEWSLLNRPERIERLAEKYLKLAPASPRQIVTVDSVTPHDLVAVESDSDTDKAKSAESGKSAGEKAKPTGEKPKPMAEKPKPAARPLQAAAE